MSVPSVLDAGHVVRLTVPPGARAETLHDHDPGDVESTLARLRAGGAAYAVIPEPHDDLRPRGYRLVAHEPGVCSVFALAPLVEPNEGLASDGLPFPPPEMVRLVAGISTPHRFYQRFMQGGAQVAGRIVDLLARNGLTLAGSGSVLDFGCGCGRVMRRWKDLPAVRLHGTDYNPYLVRWCSENLPFAGFSVNSLEPVLDIPDGKFGLVYSYSVFTHLPERMQRPWLDELVRVTAPGGHLFITFHGESTVGDLGEDERARFEEGQLVVVARDSLDYGTNACAAYHPASWVRDVLAEGLEVVDHWPGGQSFKQDAFLLRRRGAG